MTGFYYFIDKHGPLHQLRVKGGVSPWFTSELASLLRKRNQLWASARKSGSKVDRQQFRKLRNNCTAAIKKAK